MQQDLINLALWKHKDFRVFYGLLAVDESTPSENSKKQINNDSIAQEESKPNQIDSARKLTAENNSYNEEHKREHELKSEQNSVK